MKWIPIALALCACRAPKPPAKGEFEPAAPYAMLFRPYQSWTYHVAAGAQDVEDDTATSVVVKCRTDKVVPFRGGVTSHIRCDLPTSISDETGEFPLDGVWMANEIGLWHVTPGMPPTLDNATLILEARPSEGHVDPDRLTGNDEFAEIAKRDDAWCATHHQHLDVENYSTMCFGGEGVRSGAYGWKDSSASHDARFELAR
ncbi:MAG TPA: hypothetical protein VL463_18780 [Kofleriaceae bacterium]|nr:hypothetical protein [Kofleriaceae bacterium]